MDMLDLFDDLSRGEQEFSRQEIVKAPFGWPGGKSKSLEQILPKLPYYKKYIEVFGGSGAVLLARSKSKFEVYNDRFGGVCDFYRCMSDPVLYKKLEERLHYIIHSRELFYLYHDTWENILDIVERAARWYYLIIFSFAAKGKTFGRSLNTSMCSKHDTHLDAFPLIHKRLQGVLIENLDFRHVLSDFDSPDTVFYCDPPYIGTYNSSYKHEMSVEDHRDLLSCIFKCKGFVALSGYSNELYDSYSWDNKYIWEQYVPTATGACVDNHLSHATERGHVKEVLWIKEAVHG